MAKVKKSEVRRLIAVYETKAEIYGELEQDEFNIALCKAYYEMADDLHRLLGDVEVEDGD